MRSRARIREPRAAAIPYAGGRRPAHVPHRTCAGCGERSPRSLLRRLVLAGEGRLDWRPAGGRGTYLHDDDACRRRFVAGKRRLAGLRAAVGRSARELLVAGDPGRALAAGEG